RSATSALLDTLSRGASPSMFTDEVRSPVAVDDVARAIAELLERTDVGGLSHCGGPEPLSRYRLARREAEAAGIDPDLVGASTRVAAGLDAERPADLSLDSRRLVDLLGWTPRTLAV
ncbi:MAG: sugar nucleotide-binding protein, partial [Planctomycetota bacterium]